MIDGINFLVTHNQKKRQQSIPLATENYQVSIMCLKSDTLKYHLFSLQYPFTWLICVSPDMILEAVLELPKRDS